MQKTQLEIIEETVAYYGEDPSRRAVNVLGICVYKTRTGNRCAVGRCMLDDAKPVMFPGISRAVEDGPGGAYISLDGTKESLDSCLKPEYRGHGFKMWRALQDFHDCRSHFKPDGGLTAAGEECIKNLKLKIETDAK